ncbi:NB-ARC domain-containing protein [Micromonospora rubida]
MPGQLPADAEYFVGRWAELRQLTALLDPAAPRTTVVVVSGMAGVGKTTLAVHWGHQVADRFPDGQLYANLRGWQGDGASMGGEEALRTLLGGLGLSAARMPVEVPAQAALLRSLLAQRRMLLVLDNARDAEQVRPLLPGASGCLVLVTSRSRLAGLAVGHGTWSMPLDMLSAAESYALLTRRLGPARLATEPAATSEIIDRCPAATGTGGGRGPDHHRAGAAVERPRRRAAVVRRRAAPVRRS